MVYCGEHELATLNEREKAFLYLLADSSRQVVTHEIIFEQLWKEPYGDDSANMIWCFFFWLRKKMEKTEPEAAKIIQSIRKVGYYLDIDRHWAKCRKMSNYAKSDWQMTVTLHSSDSLFLYTSFCGVLVRHDKEKSYICINGSP